MANKNETGTFKILIDKLNAQEDIEKITIIDTQDDLMRAQTA
jgi:hypothetical protein